MKRLKQFFIVFCILFVMLFAARKWGGALLCRREIYSYSEHDTQALSEVIEHDKSWLHFGSLFPDAHHSPGLPGYFEKGTSGPIFMYITDIQYGAGYTAKIWLFAVVQATRQQIVFKYSRMKLDVLKDGLTVSSYLLTEPETRQVLTVNSADELIARLQKLFFQPEGQ